MSAPRARLAGAAAAGGAAGTGAAAATGAATQAERRRLRLESLQVIRVLTRGLVESVSRAGAGPGRASAEVCMRHIMSL